MSSSRERSAVHRLPGEERAVRRRVILSGARLRRRGGCGGHRCAFQGTADPRNAAGLNWRRWSGASIRGRARKAKSRSRTVNQPEGGLRPSTQGRLAFTCSAWSWPAHRPSGGLRGAEEFVCALGLRLMVSGGCAPPRGHVNPAASPSARAWSSALSKPWSSAVQAAPRSGGKLTIQAALRGPAGPEAKIGRAGSATVAKLVERWECSDNKPRGRAPRRRRARRPWSSAAAGACSKEENSATAG